MIGTTLEQQLERQCTILCMFRNVGMETALVNIWNDFLRIVDAGGLAMVILHDLSVVIWYYWKGVRRWLESLGWPYSGSNHFEREKPVGGPG